MCMEFLCSIVFFFLLFFFFIFFFFQAEDGIRDLVRSRGLGDVYKRQHKSGNCKASYRYDDSGVQFNQFGGQSFNDIIFGWKIVCDIPNPKTKISCYFAHSNVFDSVFIKKFEGMMQYQIFFLTFFGHCPNYFLIFGHCPKLQQL